MRFSSVRFSVSHFSLGSAHRGGNAFPFRRQAGKIVGEGGELAIDRDGAATRFVDRRIFEGGSQLFLLDFQRGDFHLEFVHALFFFEGLSSCHEQQVLAVGRARSRMSEMQREGSTRTAATSLDENCKPRVTTIQT